MHGDDEHNQVAAQYSRLLVVGLIVGEELFPVDLRIESLCELDDGLLETVPQNPVGVLDSHVDRIGLLVRGELGQLGIDYLA